jgi:hypothetical protein
VSKHQAMKVHKSDESEWSVSHCGRFTSGKSDPGRFLVSFV